MLFLQLRFTTSKSFKCEGREDRERKISNADVNNEIVNVNNVYHRAQIPENK